MGQVIKVGEVAPEAALERLNRITGLEFEKWPESLAEDVEEIADADYPMPGNKPNAW